MSSAENGRLGRKLGPRYTPEVAAARLKDRLIANSVVLPNGCWEWQRCCGTGGYSQIKVNGRMRTAHRIAYEVFVGPVPEGKVLDHIVCDNRRCINPWHVIPATIRENTLRSPIALCAVNARKTHCIHGHEFTPENTARNGTGRSCRACARDCARRYAARKRQEAA